MEDPNPLANGQASTSHRPTATSDFVKKLYKILEDPAVHPIISWGAKGDCFVVKDVNEFSKSILPPVYNHSNFASFVRQLNKYDFHKIRNTDDDTSGSQSWTFYHPDFHANRREALDRIKRKAPLLRVAPVAEHWQEQEATAAAVPLCSSPTSPSVGALHLGIKGLSSEIRRLRHDNEDLDRRIRTMERDHRDVLLSLTDFQSAMVQQNDLMQSIKGYVLGSCLQQPPESLKSGYMPRQICQLTPPKQAQCQAPPPYSTDVQQSQYDSRNGDFSMPQGGLLTPLGVTYTSEFPATSDVPMQDPVQSPSPDFPTSRPSPFTQVSSPWDLSPPVTYSPANRGGGSGVRVFPPSPISPSGPLELGGLGNVGMSVGETGEAMGEVNAYFTW